MFAAKKQAKERNADFNLVRLCDHLCADEKSIGFSKRIGNCLKSAADIIGNTHSSCFGTESHAGLTAI